MHGCVYYIHKTHYSMFALFTFVSAFCCLAQSRPDILTTITVTYQHLFGPSPVKMLCKLWSNICMVF